MRVLACLGMFLLRAGGGMQRQSLARILCFSHAPPAALGHAGLDTGSIPEDLWKLRNVTGLTLSNNKLSGEFVLEALRRVRWTG